MTYRMFLDDEREPPDGVWEIVRTYEAATELVCKRGLPEFISFDHDLGANPDGSIARTGADFARWLCDYIVDHHPDSSGFSWYVHSQNPIGAENINSRLNGLMKYLGQV